MVDKLGNDFFAQFLKKRTLYREQYKQRHPDILLKETTMKEYDFFGRNFGKNLIKHLTSFYFIQNSKDSKKI